MATKIENLIREEFMESVREFFKERDEVVLQVKSGTLCIPWVKDEEGGYLNISFVIPKGERDTKNKTYKPYNGYLEADNYEMETEAKRAKKAEAAKKKAEKIARDEKARAEAKQIREKLEKEKEKGDA